MIGTEHLLLQEHGIVFVKAIPLTSQDAISVLRGLHQAHG